MNRGRAVRRAHKAKKKKWAKTKSWFSQSIRESKYHKLDDGRIERICGVIAETPKTQSSCRCCINPRKVLGEKTRQEMKAELKLKEGVNDTSL